MLQYQEVGGGGNVEIKGSVNEIDKEEVRWRTILELSESSGCRSE